MILVVQSLWNEAVTDKLAEGAIKILREHSMDYKHIRVPGALEIALAIQWYSEHLQSKLQGAVAVGTVVRGETHHFEVVSNESARALTELSLNLGIPIGNGLLCTYEIDQALARAGGRKGNKGEEAAHAVLDMLTLKREITHPQS